MSKNDIELPLTQGYSRSLDDSLPETTDESYGVEHSKYDFIYHL